MLNAKEIISFFKQEINNLYFLIGVFLAKIIGDFLLISIWGNVGFEENLFWKLITTILVVFFGYLYINQKIQLKIFTFNADFDNTFVSNLKTLSMIYLISLILIFIIDEFKSYIEKTHSPFLPLLQIFGWYYIIVSYYSVSLLFNWINSKKNKRTIAYFNYFKITLIVTVVYIFIAQLINFYFDISFLSDLCSVLYILLVILLGIWSYILPYNKKDWFSLFHRYDLKNLKLYLTSFVVLSLILFFSWVGESSTITYSMDLVYPEMEKLTLLPILAMTFYGLRILLIMPKKSKAQQDIQQKVDSISTLTAFNKFILEENMLNRSHLLEYFMQSLRSAVNVDFAWVEDYEAKEDNRYKIFYNVNNSFLEQFNLIPNIKNIVNSIENVTIIASIRDIWAQIPKNVFRGSIAMIPIFERKHRVGTIFLGRKQAYSFATEEQQIMNTFAKNYEVALVNSILLQEALEKRRYQFEIQLAKGIQKKIIPQELPKIKNFSVAGISIPANELGGDYYDLIHLKNGEPTLLIADVSGKGVSAALYMSQLKGIIASISSNIETPTQLLENLNSILYKHTERQIFITLSAITIANEKGLLKYVRAGHSPLIVKSQGIILEKAPKGIALGVANSNIFSNNLEEIEIQLCKGDLVFAYTDGLDELKNKDNNEYGTGNIYKIISGTQVTKAQDLIDETLNSVKSYMNGVRQFDDLTILTLLYNGDE
jgi:serine phosphatase RsbU (regulator of sigma subunit)